MKKNNFTILISFAALALFGFAQYAHAEGVYVSPASGQKNVGDSFAVTVSVSSMPSKVFAVEGTLVFNNVECKSITVADGVVTQAVPTCAKPYFLLGIPDGTTAGAALVTVNVKTVSAGQASVALTGVDVIGEGSSLSKNSTGGDYTINTVSEPKPVVTPEKTTQPVQKTNTTNVSPKATVKTNATTQEVVATNDVASTSLDQTAAVVNSSSSPLKWFFVALGVLAVIIAGAIYYKRGKKENTPYIDNGF